jgi:hypothetical protein
MGNVVEIGHTQKAGAAWLPPNRPNQPTTHARLNLTNPCIFRQSCGKFIQKNFRFLEVGVIQPFIPSWTGAELLMILPG